MSKYLILFVVGVWGHDGLFVTKMLDEGYPPERVRRAAEVTLAGVKGYSGYFTTDDRHNTNHFFWYLPAVEHPETAPVFFWFPGWNTSSAMAIFEESGPYRLVDGGIVRTKTSWHQFCHVVYMDKMPGEGFSFTDSEEGLPGGARDVTGIIYRGILEFFRLFDFLKGNDLYIGGESFGGLMTAFIGQEIHRRDPPLNLKGLVFVCPFLDFTVQTSHYTLYQNFGAFLSPKQGRIYSWLEIIARGYLEGNKFRTGNYIIRKSTFFIPRTYVGTATGRIAPGSFLYDGKIPSSWIDFVALDQIREATHVGDRPFNADVYYMDRWPDTTYWKGVRQAIPLIIANYRALFLFGQMDIVVPYSGSRRMLDSYGGEGFENTTRRVLRGRTGEIAAYWRGDDRLAEVLLANDGHFGTCDQHLRVASLIKSFFHSHPFHLD